MTQVPSKCPPLGITARATIDRIIDGDTIVVLVHNLIWHVRLLDCWAPERGTTEGHDATAAMKAIAVPGAKCRVHIPTEDARSPMDVVTMGRVLGHVWLEGDEDSLSHHMVSLGHATVEKPK